MEKSRPKIQMNKERSKALTQLKTAKGQLEGIIRMVEEGRYCIDISNQILASQALLKQAQKNILMQHMQHCVMAAMNSDDAAERTEKTQEIADILGKLLEAK